MSWNYSDNEYLKLYRKFVNWEWYTDTNTKLLFLHMLLRANWKPGEYRGIHYEAGQFIASVESLANETGLTTRNVRTAIKHLKSTHEIECVSTQQVTRNPTVKGSVFTVVNWNRYQASDTIPDKTSGKKATRKRQDDDDRYKNNKNIEEDKKIEEPSASDEEEFIDYDEMSWFDRLEDDRDDPNSDYYVKYGLEDYRDKK